MKRYEKSAEAMSVNATELIHIWNRCHACGAGPIVGLRYTCQTCPAGMDNDLCEACHRLYLQGRVQHPPPHARDAPAGRHVFQAFEGTAGDQLRSWLSVPWTSAPAPSVPDGCVVRPEFRSGRESFFGSYGFIVAAEDGKLPLMLTALHVLDEVAKFKGIDCSEHNPAYTGRELPQAITSVQLYDPFAAKWMLAEMGTAGAMLTLPTARIGADEPYSNCDIAAFHVVPSTAFKPLQLAAGPPRVGEAIWLAANPGRGASGRTVPAVVVESTERTLIFRFTPESPMPPYTSGAPLLNRMGFVVGINIGGGMIDKQGLGHGNHVASIRHHLGWQPPGHSS